MTKQPVNDTRISEDKTSERQNYNFQQVIVLVGIALFIVKLIAWYFTNSTAVLTDAMESTVNIISAFVGLYSLYLSALPKDENHPYGHGKVEFVSAAIEGTLISVAGIVIVYEAIVQLQHPQPIARLDLGILLVSATAIVNYIVGAIALRKGKKNHSLALQASGKHLKSDTYSTIGIVAGLILMSVTHILWLDSAVALLFAVIILYTGYKIIRDSIGGIMDEADDRLIAEFVKFVHQQRKSQWIDLHNLRIIKYGSTLHMDCHMTLPYYFNVAQAHDEIEELDQRVNAHFGTAVELFVHTDPCQEFSCRICTLTECPVRKHAFEQLVPWDQKNIARNQKHALEA
jgi:cation diffusion facilitator family transporter